MLLQNPKHFSTIGMKLKNIINKFNHDTYHNNTLSFWV